MDRWTNPEDDDDRRQKGLCLVRKIEELVWVSLGVVSGGRGSEWCARGNARLAETADLVHSLIVSGLDAPGQSKTKRGIFYSDPTLFGSQRASDAALERLCSLLGDPPRHLLRVSAAPRGHVTGNVRFCVSGPLGSRVVDCRSGSESVEPNSPECLEWVEVDQGVRAVLVVEKFTFYHRLVGVPCSREARDTFVVVTGGGYPDMGTRGLVRLLAERFALPVLVMVDSDPYGVDILLTYCESLGKDIVSSKVDWLGLRRRSISEGGCSSVQSLTDADVSKISSVRPKLQRVSLWLSAETSADWASELDQMSSDLTKAELESLPEFFCLDSLIL